MANPRLTIFGASNILSDIFDCALANKFDIAAVVVDEPESIGPRDISLSGRILSLSAFGMTPKIIHFEEFVPNGNDYYILGPTTPRRSDLAERIEQRFGIGFTSLIHPSSYVSPLAHLGEGGFVGAKSVIAPGVRTGKHVFINRSVTVGHDTTIGSFSRLQPGSNIGGLCEVGKAVTIGLGASIVERLKIGENAYVGAGAVVLDDVAAHTLVAGVPAKFKKQV